MSEAVGAPAENLGEYKHLRIRPARRIRSSTLTNGRACASFDALVAAKALLSEDQSRPTSYPSFFAPSRCCWTA